MAQKLAPVIGSVDRDDMVKFLMDMIDIASPTGEEERLARFVESKFRELGLKTRLQQVEEGRYNTIAYWEGTGGGPTLMLNGHLDTSIPGRMETYYTEERFEPYLGDCFNSGIGWGNQAHIVDSEWIYGNGAFNMKNAQAAFYGAIKALKENNVRLKGDVLVTAVAGEIEKSPMDEAQGPHFRGYGHGVKWMVTHGVVADACIDGEQTGFQVMLGNAGTTWFKITTKGTFAHPQWRASTAPAIDQMAKVLPAIIEWREHYEQRHQFMGQTQRVNLGAITGGMPWRASRTALRCSLVIDVRIAPGQHPLSVKQELDAVLRNVKQRDSSLDCELGMYVSVPPCLVEQDHPVVQSLVRAHQESFGEPPKLGFWGTAYTDASHLNAYGIPTINYGCGGRRRSGGFGSDFVEGEYQNIPDLVRGAQIYAMAIADYCSQDRAAVVRRRSP